MAQAHEEYIRDFNTRKIIGILRYKENGDIEAVEFNSRKILAFIEQLMIPQLIS